MSYSYHTMVELIPEVNFCADQITELFSTNPSRYSNTTTFLSEIRRRFSSYLSRAPLLSPIKLENGEFKNGQLVRFRGSIQNALPCELFFSRFTAVMEGGQTVERTAAFEDFGCQNTKIKQIIEGDIPNASRSLYVVTTIPGESNWSAIDEGTLADELKQLELGVDSKQKNRLTNGKELKMVIRIYDELQDEFLIGDIIEFYGIFYDGINPEVENEEEGTFHIYSFPNVHIIEHRILSRIDLLKAPATQSNNDLFEKLHQFAISLTGSTTAAFYYLLAMVAKTYSWKEELSVPLCSVPFAFLQCKDPFPLIECAKLLLPMVTVLPITASLLENERLFSWMDHETGILQCGKLQLCRGTLLILDFTGYSKAAVPTDKNFVRANVLALQRLIIEQKLTIDYGVYRHGLETDISVIALCPGINTYFLKFSALIPLPKPFTDGLDPIAELRSSEHLQNFRWYLSNCRERLHTIEMGGDEQKKIVEAFSGIRSRLNTNAPDHFRHLLSLTRIRASMLGDTEMRNSIFQELMQSEYNRLDDLKKLNLI